MSPEEFKGWYHAGLAIVGAAPLGYNTMQLCAPTRRPRHAVNVVLYSAWVLWELCQAKHHWKKVSEA